MHPAPADSRPGNTPHLLRLTVRQHPGVLLHVCSLLQRRNIRSGALLSRPQPDGRTGRILIEIANGERTEHVRAQFLRLEDVLEAEFASVESDPFAEVR